MSWSKIEFGIIASLGKKKFDPKKSKNNKICIELEHIEKETGRILGNIDSARQLSTKNEFSKGDVLFGKLRPNLRKYALMKKNGVCSSKIWVLKPTEKVTSLFLFYLVQKDSFIKTACVTSGSKMPRADWGYVSEYPVLIPPLPEQKAIADLLSIWDNAIEKTESLVKAKEWRFRWLLNKLINQGSVKGEWRRVKLGDIAKIVKGQQLNVAHMLEDGKYYALNGGIELSGYTDDWNTPENTITISEGGNSCGYVNFNHEKFWSGGHCYAIREINEKVDVGFLYHFLKSKKLEIMNLRVGSGLPNIQKKDIEYFIVFLPNPSEQKQIAKTLNIAQQEINLLKKLAEAYRQQKHGLMQKLLTGQWRIVNQNE